jgi:hypothetical protein
MTGLLQTKHSRLGIYTCGCCGPKIRNPFECLTYFGTSVPAFEFIVVGGSAMTFYFCLLDIVVRCTSAYPT